MSAAGEGIGRCHVEVALPLPRFQTFTYALEAAAPPQPGTRVQVPFRNREQIGWVVGPSDPSQIQEIRGIRGVLDVLEIRVLLSCRTCGRWPCWMADYYATPSGARAAEPSA
jgi:primosomal protein N' (replication factor Y) (superfamily II helicase)